MVITVSCPACSSSFPVDPAKVPQGGVNVRCSICAEVFRVDEPAPESAFDTSAVSSAQDLPSAEGGTEFVVPDLPPPAAVEDSDVELAGSAEDWMIDLEEPAEAESAGAEEPGASDAAMGTDTTADAATEPELPTLSVSDEPLPPPEVPTPELPSLDASPQDASPADTMSFETSSMDAPSVSEDGEAPAAEGFRFGKRDPKDKARRLARVLVSDMIMYNAERHQNALASGTLAEDFEEEIDKSWKEYVDQVGEDLAQGDGRRYWTEALNDILAKGQEVF